MKKTTFIILILLYPSAFQTFSQDKYLTEKPGSYSFVNQIQNKGEKYATFGLNVKPISDYFYESIPFMKANKGFDLKAYLTGYFDEEYSGKQWNYAIRGELNFDFQLFLIGNDGKQGKWVVEAPGWAFDINNTETGHGGMIGLGQEGSLLQQLFVVFPLVSEIAPGVRYYDCESRSCGSLVVYNPERPDYWLPLTVREVVKAKLDDYKDEKSMYDFIKPLVDRMSEEELSAPAFNYSEDGILKVNGHSEGLQYMRFNPDYWDRGLPTSSVQFITFSYFGEYGLNCLTAEDEKTTEEEFYKNNGHINYPMEVNKSLNIKSLPKLIQKTK